MSLSWMFGCCSSNSSQYARAPSVTDKTLRRKQRRRLDRNSDYTEQDTEQDEKQDQQEEEKQRTESISSLILKQEIHSMCIILEQYKLEIITLLPKILQIARKAQAKKKQTIIEKTKVQIMKTINKVKQEVLLEFGSLVSCKNEDEFNAKLDKLKIFPQVQQIDIEITEAIEKALNGIDPQLQVVLEDQKLDLESYKQIGYKIYAVIRYKLYQKLKPLQKKEIGYLGENEIKDCVKDLDVEQIRQEVFKLFEIDTGLDSQLSLRKIQYLNQDDEMFQNYLRCLKEAHERFLGYIFQGYKFKKMEQNPIHSKDLNYGVSNMFTEILDELLDDTHQILAEEFQQNQIRRFSNNVSPRAKFQKQQQQQQQSTTPKKLSQLKLDDTENSYVGESTQVEDEIIDQIINIQNKSIIEDPKSNKNKGPGGFKQMLKKDLFIKNEEEQNDSEGAIRFNQMFSNNSSRVNSTRNNMPPNKTPLNFQRQTVGYPLADPFMKLSPHGGLPTSKSKKGFFQNEAANQFNQIGDDLDDDFVLDGINESSLNHRKGFKGHKKSNNQEDMDEEEDDRYIKPSSL
ncbi:UNKNOWN [Stylonychia lemnae]|uniref:Uncharacterized protein n=1 Tax=Stylonychia lemnae TaxID=5949 RepID=A0A078AFF1_STYLE|nr:UNKNOWN [Stylonychia lemnae]|eukprot:CDW79653.1 UNKNOWN [Stylonychia lemnae]